MGYAGDQVTTVFDALSPYVKNTGVFLCPDGRDAISLEAILDSADLQASTPVKAVSYAPNFSVVTDPAIANDPNSVNDPNNPDLCVGSVTVRSEGDIPLASGTTLYYDARHLEQGEHNEDVPPHQPGAGSSEYPAPSDVLGIGNFPGTARHSGGLSIVFCDGHAQRLNNHYDFGSVAPDPCYTGSGTLRVYNLPYDLNGIPEVQADP